MAAASSDWCKEMRRQDYGVHDGSGCQRGRSMEPGT